MNTYFLKKIEAGVVIAFMIGIMFASVTTIAIRTNLNSFETEWELIYTDGQETIFESARSVDTVYDQEEKIAGFITAGSRDSKYSDIFLIKTDTEGRILDGWPKIIGQSEINEGANCIQQTDDDGDGIQNDGFIIVGYKYPTMYLVKIDENGSMEWNRTYSNGAQSNGWCVQQTWNNATQGYDGYIITGTMNVQQADDPDIWVVKTDDYGAIIWSQTYDGYNLEDTGWSVQQTRDGGYIVAGHLGEAQPVEPFMCNCCLLKYDQNGTLEHDWVWGGYHGQDLGRSVKQTNEGDYIIAGYSTTYGGAWLIKQYANNNTSWNKTYPGIPQAYSVDLCSGGGYIVSGYSIDPDPNLSDHDVCVFKTDNDGNLLYSNIFGGPYTGEYGYSIQEVANGEYIVAGYSGFPAWLMYYWDTDVYLVKITEQGKPSPPTITGPQSGPPEQEFTYTFNSSDEGDEIYYYVDWGDGTYEDWFGPYNPGEETSVIHTWDAQGTYEITAKTRDEYGLESNWSEPYVVHISNNTPYLLIVKIMGGFTKITTIIENIGLLEAYNVNCTVSVIGGLLGKINVFAKESLGTLIVNEKTTMIASKIFGIGKINITVTAIAPSANIATETAHGFVMGPLIIVRE